MQTYALSEQACESGIANLRLFCTTVLHLRWIPAASTKQQRDDGVIFNKSCKKSLQTHHV